MDRRARNVSPIERQETVRESTEPPKIKDEKNFDEDDDYLETKQEEEGSEMAVEQPGTPLHKEHTAVLLKLEKTEEKLKQEEKYNQVLEERIRQLTLKLTDQEKKVQRLRIENAEMMSKEYSASIESEMVANLKERLSKADELIERLFRIDI